MVKSSNLNLSKLSSLFRASANKLQELRKHRSAALAFISGVALLALVVRAPEMHKSLIRRYVGSRVLMLVNGAGSSGGTGFYVKAPSGRTFIVTNSHVCNIPGKKLFAEINGRSVQLKTREISRHTDLCVLEQPGDVEGMSLASSLSVGDQVEILGHPRLFPLTSTSGEYTGILYDVLIPLMEGQCPADLEGPMVNNVTTVGTMFGQMDIETCSLHIPAAGISTAKSLGGSSGSPVVDWKGSVVGVVFGGIQDNNDALIIPLKDLQDFLKPY